MNQSVIFCDWCCAEGATRPLECIDPTNPLPPSEGNGWSLGLCSECRVPLMKLHFEDFQARREFHAGVTAVERRAKESM